MISEQYDYDAFGFPYVYDRWSNYIGGLPGRNRFLFTGREWIKELRLYDYRARLYQPELGRFLQPDPSGFDAGDYNLYRYCHNDPVNRIDPTGLQDEKPTVANLTHTGRGDWDFDNGRVAEDMRRQQESATVTGMPTRQANKAPNSDTPTSDTTKSMRMTIATDPATGQQKFEDEGYYRIFYAQLTQPNGKAQDGRGWYAHEEIKVRVNQCSGSSECVDGKFIVRTTNGRPLYELPRSGQARDQVGQGYHPSPGMSGTVIKDQRWWLQRGTEHKYFLPGVLRQTTTVKDGKSYNGIAPTSVPW